MYFAFLFVEGGFSLIRLVIQQPCLVDGSTKEVSIQGYVLSECV